MSRSEEITSEVRKLVLTCRSLEAQLKQSIPKKAHEEVVAKMQGAIDGLNAELVRTRQDLEETSSLGDRINAMETTIAAQSSMISSQNNVIGSLASKFSEALVLASTYNEATDKINSLQSKFASLSSDYESLQQSYHEKEEQLANSVPKSQYFEVEDRLANSVSRSLYEELEAKISQMVPKEDYAMSEAKVQDLERALLNSVPRQDYEELASRISNLSNEAEAAKASAQQALQSAPVVESSETPIAPPIQDAPVISVQSEGSEVMAEVPPPFESTPTPDQSAQTEIFQETPVESVAAPVDQIAPIVEPVVSEQQTIEESISTVQITSDSTVSFESVPVAEQTKVREPVIAETPVVSEQNDFVSPSVQESLQVAFEVPALQQPEIATSSETVSWTTAPETSEQPVDSITSTPEIREVQSQLAEISTTSETATETIVPPVVEVDFDRGFRFNATEFCARSGLEFLEDLEKVDSSIVEQHCRNGDFERWFREVLADESSVATIKSIRESNASGDEVRTLLVAAIAPRYRK